MAPQLSWDLHVHPAPSSVPRWGSGERIRAAASRAGLLGFVWKSHEEHTARRARALPTGTPRAIGSASLNDWASPADVLEAVADGARWIWGPSRASGPLPAWDLPLPGWWPALLAGLPADAPRLVLATGHLGGPGRRAMAEAAAARGHICSITHALFVPREEVDLLVGLGCRFEVDLYSAAHTVPGLPSVDLAAGVVRLRDRGAVVYLTTDAGQPAVGDPYRFSARMLAALGQRLGTDAEAEVAVAGPSGVAGALGLVAE